MAERKAKESGKAIQGRDILAVVSILAVLGSGLLIIHQSNVRLETYTQLTELRLQQDRELNEYSRLLIEKESVSSYPFVLSQAEAQGMTHPEELILVAKTDERN